MTDCTATLTTATVHDCPNGSRVNASGYCEVCRDNHVTLHTIKCEKGEHGPQFGHATYGPRNYGESRGNTVFQWPDDALGATPHKPPLVTKREVEAARQLLELRGWNVATTELSKDLPAALEAAAKVRMEDG